MKIDEVTNSARKEIRKMNDLYITHCTYDDPKVTDKLWDLIWLYLDSGDSDIRAQAFEYKTKLLDDLVEILKK